MALEAGRQGPRAGDRGDGGIGGERAHHVARVGRPEEVDVEVQRVIGVVLDAEGRMDRQHLRGPVV